MHNWPRNHSPTASEKAPKRKKIICEPLGATALKAVQNKANLTILVFINLDANSNFAVKEHRIRSQKVVQKSCDFKAIKNTEHIVNKIQLPLPSVYLA